MKIAVFCPVRTTEGLVLEVLRASGLQPVAFHHFRALLQATGKHTFEAAVLEDIEDELPQWLAHLRLQVSETLPTVVVGRAGGANVLRALQQGASDYTVISSQMAHLVNRLHAHVAVRRKAAQHAQICHAGFLLDARTHTLADSRVEVSLTSREFALARVLFSQPGQPLSYAAISAQAWGRPVDICMRTIEQHVYKLRRKLVAHGLTAIQIRAERAIGYRLVVVSKAAREKSSAAVLPAASGPALLARPAMATSVFAFGFCSGRPFERQDRVPSRLP